MHTIEQSLQSATEAELVVLLYKRDTFKLKQEMEQELAVNGQ